jgi:hypothetical protein
LIAMSDADPLGSGSISVLPRAWYVYQVRDTESRLVYVGATDNLLAALGAHVFSQSAWTAIATEVVWQTYADESSARGAAADLAVHRITVPDQRRAQPTPARPATTTEEWAALAQEVQRRRQELGISRRRACVYADVMLGTWRELERGLMTGYTDTVLAGVERALQWEPGSIAQVLIGDHPIPVAQSGALTTNSS